VGLLAIPEDGEEEDVSWLKDWAAREVANKKVELADKELDDANQTLSRMTRGAEVWYPVFIKDALKQQTKKKAEELDQMELEFNQKILELLRMHDETMQRDREELDQWREELVQWQEELYQRGEKQLCLLRAGLLCLTSLAAHNWAHWLYALYCAL
jgi:hypothetical protein